MEYCCRHRGAGKASSSRPNICTGSAFTESRRNQKQIPGAIGSRDSILKRQQPFSSIRITTAPGNRTTTTSRKQPLHFELELAQMPQADAMRNRSESSAAFARFAPRAYRDAQGEFCLAIGHSQKLAASYT